MVTGAVGDLAAGADAGDERLAAVHVADEDVPVAVAVVTDEIETWTETGIQLKSGAHLDADIIITATGLQLVTIGDMDNLQHEKKFSRAKAYSNTKLALNLFAASAPDLEGVTGKYFDPKCRAVEASPASYDQALAVRLWNKAAELTGVGANPLQTTKTRI